MTWGGDRFSNRQIDQYQLAPFLAEIPAEVMAVGERNTVLPDIPRHGCARRAVPAKRGDDGRTRPARGVRLLRAALAVAVPARWVSGRTRRATSTARPPGSSIPLVAFVPDVDALRGVGPATPPGELPACIEAVLARGGSVRSELLSAPDEYWSEIRHTLDALDAQRFSVFDGFTDDEMHRCIARSTIIECAAGDRVIKRGGTARNVFVVLDGTLEVRDGERIVNVLQAGDLLGEMAFLLEDTALLRRRRRNRRHQDPEPQRTRALRTMIEEDATVAAKLLMNISKMLCVKLIRSG